MIILGVDPGLSGAIAWVCGGALVRVEDVPTFEIVRNGKPRKELNVHGLAALLSEHPADVCFMEQVGGMPGDAPSAAFSFGRAAGVLEAVVKLSGARFEQVTPATWKRAMGLIGTAKDMSRSRATNLWPGFASAFALKKHDGRAESALIAEYGRRRLHQEGVFD